MALEWKWDKCIGEATFMTGQADNPYLTVKLYQGNATLIFIHEYEENGENMWNMYTFWVSKEHMKNCLGLNKGYQNIYKESPCKLMSIKLRKDTKDLKDIVSSLVKAFDDILIYIYPVDKENEDV